jgi:hypothetical protein
MEHYAQVPSEAHRAEYRQAMQRVEEQKSAEPATRVLSPTEFLARRTKAAFKRWQHDLGKGKIDRADRNDDERSRRCVDHFPEYFAGLRLSSHSFAMCSPVMTMPPLVTVLSVNTLSIGAIFFRASGETGFGTSLGTRFFICGLAPRQPAIIANCRITANCDSNVGVNAHNARRGARLTYLGGTFQASVVVKTECL